MNFDIFTKEELLYIMEEYDYMIKDANDTNRYEHSFIPPLFDEFIRGELFEDYYDKLFRENNEIPEDELKLLESINKKLRR